VTRSWIVVFSVALAVAACRMRDVSLSEVTGTWKITEESRSSLGSEGAGAAATIRLDPTGSFSAQDLPGSLLGGGVKPRSQYVSGGGSWKLAERNGRQEVALVFDAITSPPDTPVPYGTQLQVYGRRSSVLLIFCEGDPDAGRVIKLEKAGPGT
jgi:hypothetical protein